MKRRHQHGRPRVATPTSVYRPSKPLVARAPAEAASDNAYRPGAASSLDGRRRRDSDVVVVAALTTAATLILAYDLCLFALNV